MKRILCFVLTIFTISVILKSQESGKFDNGIDDIKWSNTFSEVKTILANKYNLRSLKIGEKQNFILDIDNSLGRYTYQTIYSELKDTLFTKSYYAGIYHIEYEFINDTITSLIISFGDQSVAGYESIGRIFEYLDEKGLFKKHYPISEDGWRIDGSISIQKKFRNTIEGYYIVATRLKNILNEIHIKTNENGDRNRPAQIKG